MSPRDRAPAGLFSSSVDDVLAEQNPWHRRGDVPSVLAPPRERPLARSLWRRIEHDAPRRFLVVLGARRVGKTTVMYQTVRHLLRSTDPNLLWWMRLDHPVLLREPLDRLVRRVVELTGATQARPVTLFLDEIVYAQDWDLWLKTFYDDHWPVRIVATSSATAALRDRHLESGVGRWLDLYLPPCSFPEFLALVGQGGADVPVGATLAETLESLPAGWPDAPVIAGLRERFLLVGGFPELLLTDLNGSEDDETLVLRSQQTLRADAIERAVYKDIPQSYGVDNPMALERLLYVLAAQSTGMLSPTTVAGELGLSQPTLDKYVGYLRQAFLLFTLPNYSGSEETVQRRGRKVYFVDGAARNAALQRGLAALDDPMERGVLLENSAAAALHTLAEHSGRRLYHWRDREDEVDLVLDDSRRPVAFEIGASARHHRKGLRALVQRFPRFHGSTYIVSPDSILSQPRSSHDGIGSLPLDVFLIACGQQAARSVDAALLTSGP